MSDTKREKIHCADCGAETWANPVFGDTVTRVSGTKCLCKECLIAYRLEGKVYSWRYRGHSYWWFKHREEVE